jgi:hypothetical protein
MGINLQDPGAGAGGQAGAAAAAAAGGGGGRGTTTGSEGGLVVHCAALVRTPAERGRVAAGGRVAVAGGVVITVAWCVVALST